MKYVSFSCVLLSFSTLANSLICQHLMSLLLKCALFNICRNIWTWTTVSCAAITTVNYNHILLSSSICFLLLFPFLFASFLFIQSFLFWPSFLSLNISCILCVAFLSEIIFTGLATIDTTLFFLIYCILYTFSCNLSAIWAATEVWCQISSKFSDST